MARTPSAVIRVGDIAECGFVFRNKAGVLTSPTTVSVEIYDETGALAETVTQTDSRVTLGATLGTTLAETKLGLTSSENSAGTGVVSVEVTPDAAGQWAVYCAGTATITGAAKFAFKVYDKDE